MANSALLLVPAALCHGWTEGREGWVHVCHVGPVEVPRVAVTSVVGLWGKPQTVGLKLDWNTNTSHTDNVGLERLAVKGWLLTIVVRKLACFEQPFWTCFHVHFISSTFSLHVLLLHTITAFSLCIASRGNGWPTAGPHFQNDFSLTNIVACKNDF